jgi:hypothetical protein
MTRLSFGRGFVIQRSRYVSLRVTSPESLDPAAAGLGMTESFGRPAFVCGSRSKGAPGDRASVSFWEAQAASL